MKRKKELFGGIKPFKMTATYIEIDSRSPLNENDDHIHNECEIYINLSGDVSFAVENSVYPVMPGGIIITRPLEYHHCIYHTNKLHKHFWILFSVAGNERLFDIFYKRELGKNNLLMLPADKTEELFSLCHRLTDGCEDEAEKYYLFFKLINLLNSANAAKLLSEGRSVTEAAELSGFAVCSNFIALFKETYQITPLRYKKQITLKR